MPSLSLLTLVLSAQILFWLESPSHIKPEIHSAWTFDPKLSPSYPQVLLQVLHNHAREKTTRAESNFVAEMNTHVLSILKLNLLREVQVWIGDPLSINLSLIL